MIELSLVLHFSGRTIVFHLLKKERKRPIHKTKNSFSFDRNRFFLTEVETTKIVLYLPTWFFLSWLNFWIYLISNCFLNLGQLLFQASPPADCRSIWVGNLPPLSGIIFSKLTEIFSKFGELTHRSPVTVVPDSKINNIAFVNFVSHLSVEKILKENPKLWIGSHLLTIRKSNSKKRGPGGSYSILPNYGGIGLRHSQADAKISKTGPFFIKAFNLPNGISLAEVFYNFKGFGFIADPPRLQMNHGTHEAFVPYVYMRDAEKVLQFNGELKIRNGLVTINVQSLYPRDVQSDEHPTSTNDISGYSNSLPSPSYSENSISQISISGDINKTVAIFGDADDDDYNKPAGIQIRCMSKLISEMTLLLYFKNNRKSNGGTVVDFAFDKNYDRVEIIFRDLYVVENIVNERHFLENQELYVSTLPPISKNMIYLENVPSWLAIDHERLENYLEAVVSCCVKLRYGENQMAIVKFNAEIDVGYLRIEFLARPLNWMTPNGFKKVKENEMKIVPVVCPDAVLVYGKVQSEYCLKLAFNELLTRYSREGNSTVRFVISKEEINMTLVVFNDYHAVDCLMKHFQLGDDLCKYIHIEDRDFPFAPFYDNLGWVPYWLRSGRWLFG